tara:strand:- start:759 stop:1697 length:939 start_codon:yes stop_codon:yes gene_type:complete
MRKILLLLCLISFSIHSQNLEKVDLIVKSYQPISTVEALAAKIDYDFKTDLEKARAIFTWITLNIRYDLISTQTNLLNSPEVYVYFNKRDLERRIQYNEDKLVTKTIQTKKALCKGIALTFQKLCTLLKIENELIKGYMKTSENDINYIAKNKNHAWNAVKIDEKWIFLDVTARIDNQGRYPKPNYLYFDISPEKLNLTHYPSKQKWISFFDQKTLEVFCNQPFFTTAFLESNAILVAPIMGNIKQGGKIKFELNNLEPYTSISFGYRNVIKKAKIIYNDDKIFAEIFIPNKESNFTLYFNDKAAISYKVKQ